MPLEFDPGDAIPIDWGAVTVYITGKRTPIQMFCGILCCSCDIFVMACINQNAESFVLHAKPQDNYRAFAAQYGFQTDFCNIASGNEKGLVEGLVNFARKDFFGPLPRVESMDELNQTLLTSCVHYRRPTR